MSVPNQAKRRGEILDEIMRHQREQLPKTMQDVPLADLRALVMLAPPPRDFLRRSSCQACRSLPSARKRRPARG